MIEGLTKELDEKLIHLAKEGELRELTDRIASVIYNKGNTREEADCALRYCLRVIIVGIKKDAYSRGEHDKGVEVLERLRRLVE